MKTWLLRIILMLQLTGLVGLYAYHSYIEKAAETYLIKCAPEDPRDLLRGDYVSLRYEISRLPERFQELDYTNQEVYITLQPSGSVWEVQDVSKVPPTAGLPYLKGHGNGREIKYGIERYYVPEGKGKNVPTDLYAQIVIQPGESLNSRNSIVTVTLGQNSRANAQRSQRRYDASEPSRFARF
jgi:uncharacterized membrane-anchored protein